MKLPICRESEFTHTEGIQRLVRSRTGGMIHGLRVELIDGTVVISGRTGTYYIKQLATHAVLETFHDLTLVNDIEVR